MISASKEVDPKTVQITARRGTIKHREQVRQKLEYLKKPTEVDDMFGDEPVSVIDHMDFKKNVANLWKDLVIIPALTANVPSYILLFVCTLILDEVLFTTEGKDMLADELKILIVQSV